MGAGLLSNSSFIDEMLAQAFIAILIGVRATLAYPRALLDNVGVEERAASGTSPAKPGTDMTIITHNDLYGETSRIWVEAMK